MGKRMITLTTLSSLNDAFVLRSMLEASEIPAFIPDENTCQMDWGYINAIGGVRVQIPEELSESAKTVLAEFQENLKGAPLEVVEQVVDPPQKSPLPISVSEQNENPLQSGKASWGGAALILLAFVLVAGAGFLVMQEQKYKRAEALFASGYAHQQQQDFAAAVADYDQALLLNPKEELVYTNRGLSHDELGEYDLAIADYTQALQLNPKDEYAYTNRGKAYSDKHENDNAIADYSQALVIDSKDRQAYFNRASAYFDQGDYASAIADYEQAILVEPNNADAYNNLAGILATCPKAELRDGKKAVELATKAFELSGENEQLSLDTMAVAYAEAGDFINAMKWENKYLESPNLKARDSVDAKARLILFEHKNAYHEEK